MTHQPLDGNLALQSLSIYNNQCYTFLKSRKNTLLVVPVPDPNTLCSQCPHHCHGAMSECLRYPWAVSQPEPCGSVRSAVSGWIQHEEPERCQGCDAGCRGDCAAHTSPPGQSGGSSLSPTAGCGARRLIRLNSSMRKTSSLSFWCGIAPSWGSGQWDSGLCHVPNVLQLQGCRNKERGGTCSGGSSEEEAEKVPDEMKAAGRGWKKGHGQRF